MAKTSINYLSPPDKINDLPTWRFILHFKLPAGDHEQHVQKAMAQLNAVKWTIIRPRGIALNAQAGTVMVKIEVPEERRRRPNSLADYESDVWKIIGNMMDLP